MTNAWPIEQREGKTILGSLFDTRALTNCTWQPFREGISILPLYGDGEGSDPHGPSAALLRYEAGAKVPLHEHPGYEHVFVLEGSQRDAHGVYERGAFFVSHPGTRHAVTSDAGCIVLVIWNQPVAFLDAEGATNRREQGGMG